MYTIFIYKSFFFLWRLRGLKSFHYRIDPATMLGGIHIVDEDNGCERIYIPFYEIDNLISDLKKVKQKYE